MAATGDPTQDGRFSIERRKMFGPFYKVRVVDTRTGREVPLFRNGGLLLGTGSADRAAKLGIDRYLREHREV
jgi:hypothetical protein